MENKMKSKQMTIENIFDELQNYTSDNLIYSSNGVIIKMMSNAGTGKTEFVIDIESYGSNLSFKANDLMTAITISQGFVA